MNRRNLFSVVAAAFSSLCGYRVFGSLIKQHVESPTFGKGYIVQGKNTFPEISPFVRAIADGLTRNGKDSFIIMINSDGACAPLIFSRYPELAGTELEKYELKRMILFLQEMIDSRKWKA